MKKKGRSELSRVLSLLGRYKLTFCLTAFLSAASVAVTLLIPRLVGRAIDRMVGPGAVDLPAVMKTALFVAVLAGVNALLQWLMTTLNNRISFGVVRDLRDRLMEKIQRLPLSYLDAHPAGETASRMIADIDQLSDGLLLGSSQLLTGLMTIAGTLLFMLGIDWRIALVVVFLTPLSLLAAGFVARRTHDLFLRQSELRGRQTGYIDEMLTGEKVVQAFSREGRAIEEFDRINEELSAASRRAVFFSSVTNPATRFVNAIVYAAVALFGAFGVIAGRMSVGSLSTFLSYANQYTKPFNEISGVITELQNALACAGRVFDLLEETEEIPDRADASVLPDGASRVTMRDVVFSYDPARPLIRGFSLTAEPGKRIALVGPTGCGKTTVINLLMRFYETQGGVIEAGGTDIRDLTRRSLRAGFGMVLQETWLKSGTIRENLCLGRPDATDEEMIRAAKAAHAHSFIRRLPDGYDTVIREDGEGLSQGQKQLLCIARVMLTDPPMLILDEATSSIDTRTELKVQEAFARLMEGRTSLIVAHRLSTIRSADTIIVMKAGRIIERGTHEELMKENGFYAGMYRAGYDTD